jgi:hypothetical protein
VFGCSARVARNAQTRRAPQTDTARSFVCGRDARMRHGLAGQRRGRGATRIRASSWWVIRRSGSGLRAARSVSMRCGCGRCVVRPPCQRSDGCRLSRIKAPFTLARERDSMRHTKLQSQAWPSTTRNWMMMRKGVPLRAHSCPYLSLDRSRLRFFVENRNGQLGRLCCFAP